MTTDRVIVVQTVGAGIIPETLVYNYSERVMEKLVQQDINSCKRANEKYTLVINGDDSYNSVEEFNEKNKYDEVTEVSLETIEQCTYYEVRDIIRSV